MTAPIIISIIALSASLILPAIAIYNFFINRKIYADIQEEYYQDRNGDYKIKTLIVLSTKGISPMYYTDYRIIIFNCETGMGLAQINEDDIPPTSHPGVITNAEPKIIVNHGFSKFPNEIKGEKVEYKIELRMTGRKKTKIIPLRKQEWAKFEYDYGNDEFEYPFDEE